MRIKQQVERYSNNNFEIEEGAGICGIVYLHVGLLGYHNIIFSK